MEVGKSGASREFGEVFAGAVKKRMLSSSAQSQTSVAPAWK